MSSASGQKRYAAFISYRHVSPDMEIAKALHAMLEHNQVRPNRHAPRNIRPVFLDTSELPTLESLDDGIIRALENAECLYVICSPDLPKSRYCLREIEYFKQIHGGRLTKVYTVLVRGMPQESFPSVLCSEMRAAKDENGADILEETIVEPLFADVRAPSLRQSLQKLRKTEYLRLAAAYYGCSYDDLYKRRSRWILRVASMCAVSLLMAGAAFSLYVHARNQQYNAARAATYASYAEEQIRSGNELLAMTLCEESRQAAERSRSARYGTALRSAAVQHDFRLNARPAARVMTVDCESTLSPIFYLNDDSTLAMCITNNLFWISDTKTGEIIQQFPADSIAISDHDRSVYTYVEARKDETGKYRDTLSLRTLDGQVLAVYPFRDSDTASPKYKLITDPASPGVYTLTDDNEDVFRFTMDGEQNAGAAEDASGAVSLAAAESEPPFSVVLGGNGLVRKGKKVIDQSGRTVLEMDGQEQITYAFSKDYRLFGYVAGQVLTVYETENWTSLGSMVIEDGLLQKVQLPNDTSFALCIFRTPDYWSRSVLYDWRSGSALIESCGYTYLDEANHAFFSMEAAQLAKYSYRNLHEEDRYEVCALYGNRMLIRQSDKVALADIEAGTLLWEGSCDPFAFPIYDSALTRILAPCRDALRCLNGNGEQLWKVPIPDAEAALSADGALAAFLDGSGDVLVVDAQNGETIRTVSAEVFDAEFPPSVLAVSGEGLCLRKDQTAIWIPAGEDAAIPIGDYNRISFGPEGYLILENTSAYVMDFALWSVRDRAICWQPDENTGLWAWSAESGYLVRHKEISGNYDTSQLMVYRMNDGQPEAVSALPLPERDVWSLTLDSTGQWLSVSAGDTSLIYRLSDMEKQLQVIDCPLFYENGMLWDRYAFGPVCYSFPFLEGDGLHAHVQEALTGVTGVRTLSEDEKNRYSFSE